MLARAARTNKINISQEFLLLKTAPVFFCFCDGPASFTQKIIRNLRIMIERSILNIRSLKLNEYKKNVNRFRSPGGNSGSGNEWEYFRRT
jgi:hypothetical protein